MSAELHCEWAHRQLLMAQSLLRSRQVSPPAAATCSRRVLQRGLSLLRSGACLLLRGTPAA
jgi:hypothetical protein